MSGKGAGKSREDRFIEGKTRVLEGKLAASAEPGFPVGAKATFELRPFIRADRPMVMLTFRHTDSVEIIAAIEMTLWEWTKIAEASPWGDA